MALIKHYTRGEDGGFSCVEHEGNPMNFVIENIPDGTPIKIYLNSLDESACVTEDFDALDGDGVFYIVEGVGGGAVSGVLNFVGKILNPILKLLTPSQKVSTPGLDNSQAQSPNNSLTDRNNKPRPYQRTYDICGTVQSIPSDLMTTYRVYNRAGNVIEYGFYDVARDYVQTLASDVTDGDTLYGDITGSSCAVYPPFSSPNSGSPQLVIGDVIDQGLFITATSNEVDGQTLKAPDDLQASTGATSIAALNGTIGTIVNSTGDSEFNEFLSVGDIANLTNIYVDLSGTTANLTGYYTVLAVSEVDISLDVTGNLAEWQKLGVGIQRNIRDDSTSTIGPLDTVEKSFTDWITIDRIKSERVLVNISADNGMYKDNGSTSKQRASVDILAQYQLIDDNGAPYGSVMEASDTASGRSTDSTGVTLYITLPTASAVRVRVRRMTFLDRTFEGQVVDEIKFANLYGQARDLSPHYGNRTTIHTARRQTARATAVKQPQLKMVVTEMVFKYLGNGIFDSVRTPNTQAVQSLIRLLRDPIVGGMNLSNDNMDELLDTQSEVEDYFMTPLAGEFCYTFDSYQTTTQDIITTIAEAIFCSASRRGHSIVFNFERPRAGGEMVFTHRSKIPGAETWQRQFFDKSAFDSLKFSYIDPETNIKETITIPEGGGVKTDTYDSKGIRNASQAHWHAYRRYQKNLLSKVTVNFSSTEEGILAIPSRPISVVKGSRVSPYDGYIIAVNGLLLDLSQNVSFSDGDNHSIILKHRDGTVESINVTPGNNTKQVVMLSAPQQPIYTGNSALKTEFSFGSEERHKAQMMIVQTVTPSDDRTVAITASNYHPDFYLYDGVPPFERAFSNGFDLGFL